jgi:hypothetical protein
VGAPAFYSERQFLDLSGLTDYRFVRIWKENLDIMHNENYFYQLINTDPNEIISYESLQGYYEIFFDTEPDFVYFIANAPSYVIMVHPEFKENYEIVWLKTRQDNFRGYYAIYAKKDSSCIQDIDFDYVYVNEQLVPRSAVNG